MIELKIYNINSVVPIRDRTWNEVWIQSLSQIPCPAWNLVWDLFLIGVEIPIRDQICEQIMGVLYDKARDV